MLRGCMLSAALCDCGDPEEVDKLWGLAQHGIHFISTLVGICRPKFCRYPFRAVAGQNGLSSATYDLLAPHDLRWWEHAHQFVANANTAGIGIQFDVLSNVTARHGEYMYLTHNVQGIKPSLSLFERVPTGLWEEVLIGLLQGLVPLVNACNLAAILPCLEGGSAARPMCAWMRETMLSLGLKESVYWISNSGAGPGFTNSPHLHSVSEFRKYKVRGGYASTDGWSPSATQMRQCVDSQRAQAVAIELWSPYLSSDRDGDYSVRGRPSLAFIKSKCGEQIVECGRA